MRMWMALGAAVAATIAGAAAAQEAPAAQQTAGAGWGAFSRDPRMVFLIATGEIVRDGDVATAKVARVRKDLPAGDYSHVVDVFQVQCEGMQSHMLTSTDVEEDGEPGEAYPADEPWTPIRAGSFDEMIKTMACAEAVPVGDLFPSIKAFIDAGRP